MVSAGPPAPKTTCHFPGPNEVSDDDHPSIIGLDEAEGVESAAWFKARGTTFASAQALYRSRHQANAELPQVCVTTKLGDPLEDALVCHHVYPRIMNASRLVAYVVRNKRPVILWDVLMDIGTLADSPRYLDLTFVLHGPTKFELRPRAPEGSVIIWPPSLCMELEKKYGPNPQEPMTYPGVIHDCEGAKKALASAFGSPPYSPQTQDEMSYVKPMLTRACTQEVGVWTWKNGQFVRDTPPKP